MRRWGDGDRFLERIAGHPRPASADAAFRSSFIVGYPGETEEDHDQLLGFLEAAPLDWAGFFAFSREEGTYAAGLADVRSTPALVAERLAECGELQDAITARRRRALVGTTTRVLVDRPGVGAQPPRGARDRRRASRLPDGAEPGRRFVGRVIVDVVDPDRAAGRPRARSTAVVGLWTR